LHPSSTTHLSFSIFSLLPTLVSSFTTATAARLSLRPANLAGCQQSTRSFRFLPSNRQDDVVCDRTSSLPPLIRPRAAPSIRALSKLGPACLSPLQLHPVLALLSLANVLPPLQKMMRKKKNVKKGIQFCLMVCGASGTGTTRHP
jgi:hypothetical protein